MNRMRRGHQGGFDGGNAPFRIPATGARSLAFQTTSERPLTDPLSPLTLSNLRIQKKNVRTRARVLRCLRNCLLWFVAVAGWKGDISKLVRGGLLRLTKSHKSYSLTSSP